MSLLADLSIIDRLDAGDLGIEPLSDRESQIQPSGVDLRLGEKYQFVGSDKEQWAVPGTHLTIEPGKPVFVQSQETLRIPRDLSARMSLRASLGFRGVSTPNAGGVLTPGFEGVVAFRLQATGPDPVTLTVDKRFAHVQFQELDQPAGRVYDEHDSQYHQHDGVSDVANE